MDQVAAQTGVVAFRASMRLTCKVATGIRVREEFVALPDGGTRPRVHAEIERFVLSIEGAKAVATLR